MIYFICNNDEIKNHWQLNITDKIYFLESIDDIFNLKLTSSDILVVSLDIFTTIQKIQEFFSHLNKELKIVAFREIPNLAEGTLLIKNGINGYCDSYIKPNILNELIKTVKNGDTWVYPKLMQFIIKHINVDIEKTLTNDFDILSPKEKEIASLIALGNSNKDIANSLNIALVTVKKHIGHIFEKLNIKDRVSLAILVNKKSI